MKSSRQELSIDMVIHSVIFKNNQITPFPCVTFIATVLSSRARVFSFLQCAVFDSLRPSYNF